MAEGGCVLNQWWNTTGLYLFSIQKLFVVFMFPLFALKREISILSFWSRGTVGFLEDGKRERGGNENEEVSNN